jgi:ABC-type nickel/cobalt efflux system permease component RcnA
MGDKLLGSMPLQTGCIDWRDEQISAILNLIVSFGLGIMMLVIVAVFTSICYPRQQYMAENRQEKRISKGYRLLTIGLMLRRFHVVRMNQFDDQQGAIELILNVACWLRYVPYRHSRLRMLAKKKNVTPKGRRCRGLFQSQGYRTKNARLWTVEKYQNGVPYAWKNTRRGIKSRTLPTETASMVFTRHAYYHGCCRQHQPMNNALAADTHSCLCNIANQM